MTVDAAALRPGRVYVVTGENSVEQAGDHRSPRNQCGTFCGGILRRKITLTCSMIVFPLYASMILDVSQ